MDFDLKQATAVLQRTPAALRALLEGLGPAWIKADEGPETFSPFDVLGHLIHGEETDWLPRLRRIIDHGESVPFDPYDRFAQRELSRNKTLGDLLARFADRRSESLATLRSLALTPADLARTGMHPSLGRVTAAQLLATWVAHDLGHIAQITRVMAKQYTDAVGPWRQYLPVLDDRRKSN